MTMRADRISDVKRVTDWKIPVVSWGIKQSHCITSAAADETERSHVVGCHILPDRRRAGQFPGTMFEFAMCRVDLLKESILLLGFTEVNNKSRNQHPVFAQVFHDSKWTY